MIGLLQKTSKIWRRYNFYRRLHPDCVVDISPISKIDLRKISLSQSCRLKIADYCIIRGNLQCQKPGATLEIGERSFVGSNTNIVSTATVRIGSDVLVAHDCYITDTDGHSLIFEERKRDIPDRWKGRKNWNTVTSLPVVLEDGSWIGPKSTILKGVKIGAGSVVAAGSVVTKDIPPGFLVGGVPARTIKKL